MVMVSILKTCASVAFNGQKFSDEAVMTKG